MHGRDLTRGSVPRLLVVLALPVLGSFVLQSLYALADMFFVGYLGGEAVAGLGISLNFFFIVVALGQTLGTGAMAFIAQAYGAGRAEETGAVFRQVFWLTVTAGGTLWAAGWWWAEGYFELFTADPAVRAAGLAYFRIYAATFLIQSMLMVFGACWRAIGDFWRPTLLMSGNVLLNTALDPLLIFGWGPIPAMGMAGAAWATVIAQGSALLVYAYWMLLGRGLLHLHGPLWLDWRRIASIVRVGAPAGVQMLLATLAMALIYRAVRPFGAEATAAVGLGFRILHATIFPAVAIGAAAASLVGQNTGAGRGERVRAALLWGLALAVGVMVAELAVLLAAPAFWASLFVSEPGVIAPTALYLVTHGLANPFVAVTLIITFSSQAMGRTLPPLAAVTVRVGVYAGLLYGLAAWRPDWLDGLFWSHPLAMGLEALAMGWIGLTLLRRARGLVPASRPAPAAA